MAEPTYGMTFEEDFNARRRMLPQAIGAARPAQAQQGFDPEAQLMELVRQRAAMDEQQPDVSALQEYARRQGEAGQSALLNALAAQYAGEGFQPLQAKFLKQAEASQQPLRVGGGMLTPTGEFIRNPFEERERQTQMLDRRIGGLERVIDARQARAERSAQAERELALRETLGMGRLEATRAAQEARNAARSASGAASAASGTAAENRNFQQATTLRGEYTRRADKISEGVRHAETVLSLLNDPSITRDPTKQVSLIFAFGKLLDPESVVRESEYALIANARGFFQSLEQMPERIRSGSRLAPDQLASIRQVAAELYSGAGRRRNDLTDFYRGIAQRRNIPVEDILPSASRIVDFKDLPR